MLTQRSLDRPLKRPDIQERSAGGDLVLYDVRRGRLHVLNPSAGTVWRLCDGRSSVSQIATRLTESFQVEPGVDVEADVVNTLQSFLKEQLLAALEPEAIRSDPEVGRGES